MNKIAIAAACAALASPAAFASVPNYTIVDLGVVGSSGTDSQGNDISNNGLYAVGRSLGSSQYTAFSWTNAGGIVALPNIAGRNFAVAHGVNNAGIVVGDSTATAFGSGALPVMWQNGTLTQLDTAGYSVAHAWSINSSGVIAGYVGSGIDQHGAILGVSGTQVITATTAGGAYMTYGYDINDSGLFAGQGVDPNNAARNVGLVYDTNTGTLTDIGSLPGQNGSLPFAISNSGYVVGSSTQNQAGGTPFIWSSATGMTAIPLVVGASQASARGVNDAGWVVGIGSGLYAVPFLYADGTTYSFETLISNLGGWDLDTNTSSAAYSISDDGTVVGSGVIDGHVHAYVAYLNPVPEPGTWALMAAGMAAVGLLASRRRA